MENIENRMTFSRAFAADGQRCVYVGVDLEGVQYCLQISRPRHPSNVGEELEEGAAIYCDEGHDDNSDFAYAVEAAGGEFERAAAYAIEKSGAEAALTAAERGQ